MSDNVGGPNGVWMRTNSLAPEVVGDRTREVHVPLTRLDLGSGTTESPVLGTVPMRDGLAIARDLVTGCAAFRKFGANTNVVAAEVVVSTVGTKWQPTAAANLEAVSSSANDGAGTGAGALTLTVVGLDANWNEVTQVLTLAGTAASAATTTALIRVYRAYVSSVGTYGGTNVGTLTLRVAAAGATVMQIVIGRGQTQTTFYTVPAAKVLYLTSVHLKATSTKALDLRFYQLPNVNDITTPFSGAQRLVQEYDGIDKAIALPYDPPLKFGAYTDLWFTAQGTATASACSVEYVGVLCDA